jgi:hypothetical protein
MASPLFAKRKHAPPRLPLAVARRLPPAAQALLLDSPAPDSPRRARTPRDRPAPSAPFRATRERSASPARGPPSPGWLRAA